MSILKLASELKSVAQDVLNMKKTASGGGSSFDDPGTDFSGKASKLDI